MQSGIKELSGPVQLMFLNFRKDTVVAKSRMKAADLIIRNVWGRTPGMLIPVIIRRVLSGDIKAIRFGHGFYVRLLEAHFYTEEEGALKNHTAHTFVKGAKGAKAVLYSNVIVTVEPYGASQGSEGGVRPPPEDFKPIRLSLYVHEEVVPDLFRAHLEAILAK